MTLFRHQRLTQARTAYLVVLVSAACMASAAWAGPLSGPRQTTSSNIEALSQQNESTVETQVDVEAQGTVATNDPFLNYLEAVRSQVLPDMANPSLDDGSQIDLDGLQGWSLNDIKTAMDAAALGLDQDPSTQQINENQPSALTVSVEDLYNFNTGYYFVLENTNPDEDGDLVSGPNLPEIIGQTALSEIELDIVSLSASGINLDMETSVGMLDDSFFTSTTTSSGGRTIGGGVFRGGGAGPIGGRQSSSQGQNAERTNLGNFISQSIQFIKDNVFGITLVVLGFTGIGYVTSRFA